MVQALALRLGLLNVDFKVTEPAELVAHLNHTSVYRRRGSSEALRADVVVTGLERDWGTHAALRTPQPRHRAHPRAGRCPR
ncbi:hypothetical protein [Streptomyces sp. NPDC090445]|uniref:hypothetical protein n=1 Tax=Streptomyces sp. NPDC090445 TaxID=3365963 RepID=UPI0038297849